MELSAGHYTISQLETIIAKEKQREAVEATKIKPGDFLVHRGDDPFFRGLGYLVLDKDQIKDMQKCAGDDGQIVVCFKNFQYSEVGWVNDGSTLLKKFLSIHITG